jgi:hypothetical protein
VRTVIADVLAFALGDKGQYQQHQVGYEGVHQVLAVAGVERGLFKDVNIG